LIRAHVCRHRSDLVAAGERPPSKGTSHYPPLSGVPAIATIGALRFVAPSEAEKPASGGPGREIHMGNLPSAATRL
jgi:hypothetical protein